MSWLWSLLERRAGHEDLPADIGLDPEPNGQEPEEEPPEPQYHLTAEDYRRAADDLGVPVAALRALAEVEANGDGFLPDRRPKILYEAHVFGRLTQHRHDRIRDPRNRPISARRWDRSLYGAAGAWQWTRLNVASGLDWNAAHEASSWGAFQVMGINAKSLGYTDVREFVGKMSSGAPAHLDSLVRFIRSRNLVTALNKRDWKTVALRYNGSGYASNRYDQRLAASFHKHSARA